jgi:hypothetical protein
VAVFFWPVLSAGAARVSASVVLIGPVAAREAF